MSALIFCLQRARIVMMADSRAHGFPGGVEKTWVLPRLGTVVAGRGPCAVPFEVALHSAAIASNFDELAANLPTVLDKVLRDNVHNIAMLQNRQIELYLAGLSSQGTPTV